MDWHLLVPALRVGTKARHVAEDAADAVQGFMEKLCAQGLIAQIDARKGKLRSWLLAAFSNYLATSHTKATRQKRGGGAEHIAVDFTNVEAAYLAHSSGADTPERIYARTWALTLMDEALERIAQHYENYGEHLSSRQPACFRKAT